MSETVDKIDEVAAEGIEGFFTKLTEVTDTLTDKLVDIAPEAADALLSLVQFKGVFHIVSPFLILITILAVGVFSVKRLYKWAGKFDMNPADEGLQYVPMCVVGGLTIILSGVHFFKLFNFYNWLSAFYPEGAIALKALEAVGIDL